MRYLARYFSQPPPPPSGYGTSGITACIQDNVVTVVILLAACAVLGAARSGNVGKGVTVTAGLILGVAVLGRRDRNRYRRLARPPGAVVLRGHHGHVTTKTTARALRRFVRRTQASDWEALDQALRDAINGVWSMAASRLAARIVAAARLVGPTPPKSVPWRLVSGGVYDAVLDAGEVPHASLTPEFVAETDARMAEYGPVGPAAVRHFARTVEEIRSTAESAWISRGGE